MGDKKHIDRIFQEKFKDFETAPSEDVWLNIEAKLKEKKKKRRIIPIWWRYAGVAALLILFLTIARKGFDTDKNNMPENIIVDTESSSSNKILNNDNTSPVSTKTGNSNGIINDSDNLLNDAVIENEAVVKNNNLEDASTIEKDSNKNTSSKLLNAKSSNTVATINKSNNDKDRTQISSKSATNPNSVSSNSALNKNNDQLISSKKTAVARVDSNEEQKEAFENDALFDSERTNSLLKDLVKTDTSAIAENPLKVTELEEDKNDETELTIEEAIENVKDIIEEEKFNRWSIAPNAAPVYFNSLGEGSSIDQQFNTNTKTGDINMSYGVRASYAVNKKLRIRSGINRVSLGYTTNNVIAFQSFSSQSSSLSQLANIKSNYSVNAVTTTSFVSADNISSKSSTGLLSNSVNTAINQEFGYIEIPLEVQYSLLNKKFGINVIGGFSSFFLNENKLYTESNGSRSLLGEAANINDVSYSANFGLGLNYKVSKRFDLNLEPIFKYQFNTFENTSGDFKPYFIGVYTGLAIKF